MRCLLILFVTIFIFQPANAHALSCFSPQGKNLIQQSDLIIKGKATAVHENKVDKQPDSFTTFEVSEIIKGNPAAPIKVYHSRNSHFAGASVSFRLDDEAYIFARRAHDEDYYVVGPCMPTYYISDIKKHAHYASRLKTIQDINTYHALIKSADKLIEDFGTDEAFLEKAKILEEYRDFEQAEALYIELLKRQYKEDFAALVKSFQDHPNSAYGVKNWYKTYNDQCIGPYRIKEDTPDFLKPFPAPAPEGYFLRNTKYLLPYAKNLFHQGKYQDVLRPLCLLSERGKNTADFQKIKTQTLVILEIREELNNKPLKLSQAALNKIDLPDLRMERSDFSKSNLRDINFANSILVGSDFSESKISRINANGTNLSGSFFDKANISGDWTNSDLSYIKGTEVKLGGDMIGTNLSGAVLEGAVIYGDLSGANLENANLEGAYIFKLAGAKLKNTNLNHINSRFKNFRKPSDFTNIDLSGYNLSGSDLSETIFTRAAFVNTKLIKANLTGSKLTDADFRGADMQDADLSSSTDGQTDLRGADFSNANIEGVIWIGGLYDCNTKFPEGFNPSSFLLVTTDKSCGSNAAPDYSWNTLLSPPAQHYRALPSGSLSTFENINMNNANFEGGRLYQPDPNGYNYGPRKNESRPGKTTFRNVSLKNANFRHSVGEFDFFGSDLEGADFSYSNIKMNRHYATYEPSNVKGAKFYCTDMKEIRTKFLNIEEADLTAAIYNSLNVSEWKKEFFPFNPVERKILFRFMQKIIDEFGPADYSNMNFNGCDLMDIDFGSTDLSGSTFKGAYFYRTNFHKAKLTGASFDGARISNSAKLPNYIDVAKHKLIPTQILNGNTSPWSASSGGAKSHLTGMYSPPPYKVPSFAGEDLSETVFLGAWLPDSDMSGVNIRFSDFTASNLYGANLSNAKAKGVVFYDAVLSNADLSAADLQGADLRWADLNAANLKNTNFKNSIYDANTKWPDGFDPEKAGAYLIGAKEKPTNLPEIPDNQKFKSLASNTEILSLGIYGVGNGCEYSTIANCTIKITVQNIGKPVLLVLSAHERTNWDITLDNGTELEGVILSGLYPQTIQGIPGNVKVVNFTDGNSQDPRLKFYVHDPREAKNVEKMNNIVKALTGRHVSKIVGQYNMPSFIIK